MGLFTSDDVKLQRAAVRAGIRTAAQSGRAAIVTTAAAIGVSLLGVDWLVVAGIAGAGVLNAGLAGGDAYLSVISKGVPDEYADAELARGKHVASDDAPAPVGV